MTFARCERGSKPEVRRAPAARRATDKPAHPNALWSRLAVGGTATPVVQRQEAGPSPDPDLDEEESLPSYSTGLPDLGIGAVDIDWFEMSRPFHSRGASHLLYHGQSMYGAIETAWLNNYQMFSLFGFGSLAVPATNFFTPFTIDAALNHDYPTAGELFERDADISSIIVSPTVFSFDVQDIPGTFRLPFLNIFGAGQPNPYAPTEPPSLQRMCAGCEEEQATAVQPKLAVGPPDDAYEREADAVAEQVMRMPASPDSFHGGEPRISRAPDGQPAAGSSEFSGRGGAAVSTSASGGGQPLAPEVRRFFESRIGQDFEDVRVHTGAEADEAARSINAIAFTHGSDVTFGKGRFEPNSQAGRRLLAHELTHVVQQRRGEGPGHVQRDMDTRIHQLPRAASSHDHRIFFDYNRSTIPSTETSKLDALGTRYSGQEVKLFGRASEEGDATHNENLINRRIRAVRRALERRGVVVYATESRLADSTGQIDYRFQRSVEVVARPSPTPDNPNPDAPSTQDPCSRANAELAIGDRLTSCQNKFGLIWPRALLATALAYVRLSNPLPDPRRDRLLGRIFTGVDPAVVRGHVRNLLMQVARAPSVISCRSECDASCTRPMSNSNTGTSAVMKLCPDFYRNASNLDFYTYSLIHESAHGTPGLAADDIAYRTNRRFEFLPPAESVRNTDSYTQLVLMLGDLGTTWTIGPATPDTTPGLDPATEDAPAREAVAYLEEWLNYGAFDTGLTYDFIGRSLAAWSTGLTNDTLGTNMMEKLGDDFALSKPSAEPHARSTDRHRMAAIHDRYARMYRTIHRRAVEIRPASEGRESWDSAAGLPGAGNRVSVPPSFFTLALTARIKKLTTLLATALSDVSAAFASKYATALDHIRRFRRLGP